VIVYLDNSALNRPFDDQKQARIWLETLALSVILQLIETGAVEAVRSPAQDLENSENPFALRQQWVDKCLRLARRAVALDATVKTRALDCERQGLKPLDALHVASAERAGVTHFLTCDDRLQRRYSGTMIVLNPVDFVLLWSEENP